MAMITKSKMIIWIFFSEKNRNENIKSVLGKSATIGRFRLSTPPFSLTPLIFSGFFFWVDSVFLVRLESFRAKGHLAPMALVRIKILLGQILSHLTRFRMFGTI